MRCPAHPLQLAVGLVAALLLAATTAAAAPPLPQRNLLVETRIVDDNVDARQGGAAAGTVTLGSTGRVEGAGAVALLGNSSRQSAESVQRVLVLNGAAASLRLSQGMALPDTEVWWTPWGAGAGLRSQWIELVNGMEVRPRWPGGSAPVTLELAAQRSTQVRASPGWTQGVTPPQLTLFTTVQAPLGEWVEVAQLQRRQSSVSRSGFDAATASRQRRLQVRVSLP
ncbi:MAG: hypothetical protein ACRC2B_11570 [Rubrivivax sp.]